MLKYSARRILLFIPTLIIISLLAFVISVHAPGDPVERLMSMPSSEETLNSNRVMMQQRVEWTHRLGLDLPVFYFELTSLSCPDSLYRIPDQNERQAIESLIYSFGNPDAVISYHHELKLLNEEEESITVDTFFLKKNSPDVIHNAVIQSRFNATSLLYTSNRSIIQAKMDTLTAL